MDLIRPPRPLLDKPAAAPNCGTQPPCPRSLAAVEDALLERFVLVLVFLRAAVAGLMQSAPRIDLRLAAASLTVPPCALSSSEFRHTAAGPRPPCLPGRLTLSFISSSRLANCWACSSVQCNSPSSLGSPFLRVSSARSNCFRANSRLAGSPVGLEGGGGRGQMAVRRTGRHLARSRNWRRGHAAGAARRRCPSTLRRCGIFFVVGRSGTGQRGVGLVGFRRSRGGAVARLFAGLTGGMVGTFCRHPACRMRPPCRSPRIVRHPRWTRFFAPPRQCRAASSLSASRLAPAGAIPFRFALRFRLLGAGARRLGIVGAIRVVRFCAALWLE